MSESNRHLLSLWCLSVNISSNGERGKEWHVVVTFRNVQSSWGYVAFAPTGRNYCPVPETLQAPPYVSIRLFTSHYSVLLFSIKQHQELPNEWHGPVSYRGPRDVRNLHTQVASESEDLGKGTFKSNL